MIDEAGMKKIENLRQFFIAKIKRDGKSICPHCLKEVRIDNIASIGVFVPESPGITGKLRVVVYAVCKPCMSTPDDRMAQKIEDNLTRSGVFFAPGTEGVV